MQPGSALRAQPSGHSMLPCAHVAHVMRSATRACNSLSYQAGSACMPAWGARKTETWACPRVHSMGTASGRTMRHVQAWCATGTASRPSPGDKGRSHDTHASAHSCGQHPAISVLFDDFQRLEQLQGAAAAMTEQLAERRTAMDAGGTLMQYGEQLNQLLVAMATSVSQGQEVPHDLLGAVVQRLTWGQWLAGRQRSMEKCPGIKTDGIQALFQLAAWVQLDTAPQGLTAQFALALDALYFFGKYALPVHPSDAESPGIPVSIGDCLTLMAAARQSRLPHLKYVAQLQRVLATPTPGTDAAALRALEEAVQLFYEQFGGAGRMLAACGVLDGPQVRDMARYIQTVTERSSDPKVAEGASAHVYRFCVELLTDLQAASSTPAPPRAPTIPGSPFQLRVAPPSPPPATPTTPTSATSAQASSTDEHPTTGSIQSSGGEGAAEAAIPTGGQSSTSSGAAAGAGAIPTTGSARASAAQPSPPSEAGPAGGWVGSMLQAVPSQPLYTQDVARVCAEVVWLVCKDRGLLTMEMRADLLSLCHAVMRQHRAVFDNPTSVLTFLDNSCTQMAHPRVLSAAVQLLALWPEPCLSAAGQLVAALTHRLHWFSDEEVTALLGPLHRLARAQAHCVREWYRRLDLEPEPQAQQLLGEAPGHPQLEILMCGVAAPHDVIRDYADEFAGSAWDLFPARGPALEESPWQDLDLASRMGLRVAHLLAHASEGVDTINSSSSSSDSNSSSVSVRNTSELKAALLQCLGLQ